jgi:hypothetical protein
MRIDITSFFFNTTIPGATATAAWGTSAGQSKLDGYKIKTETYGLVNLLIGMNYKICSDIENLDISKMSKNRELLFFSIFDKVFINGMQVTNSFILLFVKEHSETHNGRLIISYPPYVTYDDKKVDNNKTIKEFENKLGVSNGSWFVYDISVLNQDELHFSAIVVDSNKSMTYKSSKERGEIWKDLIDEKEPSNKNKHFTFDSNDKPIQLIIYGAPGTGKSHKVKEIVAGKEERTERVTFHPEYDYNAFVGGYKPTMNGNDIRYEFVPQTFSNIYVKAWNDLETDYYLIIEEINRGNCAEIFGDIFQLLDRNNEYQITPSKELREYLIEQFAGNPNIDGNKLILPPNLNILATMNTSDQSLFPMDSAFKRRWDWEYIPINYEEKEENKSSKFRVLLSDTESFSWLSFIKEVNSIIKANDNLGMDKCLGNYFIKATDNNIDIETFINKAIFYLWNDVFKDETEENNIFLNKTTYEDFFPIHPNGIEKVKEILNILNIKIIG